MDIISYLQRVNFQGPLAPTAETLNALHYSHVLAVPFENLDIHLGQPILLDEEHLFDKIVTRRRGGFCFELNGLFAALLRELGFNVALLASQVGNGQRNALGPEFDHLALLVRLEEDWLVDVSFGRSFVEPLKLDEPAETMQRNGVCRRVRQDGDGMRLEWNRGGQWVTAYRFNLQPRQLSDFDEACYHLQTSPKSTFTQRRICYRATRDGQISLRDMRLIINTNGQRREQDLVSQYEYGAMLQKHFQIQLYPLPMAARLDKTGTTRSDRVSNLGHRVRAYCSVA
jgi:N-hydroxyarylamine O-acetyltransferase